VMRSRSWTGCGASCRCARADHFALV
jgi:hypothetical protein